MVILVKLLSFLALNICLTNCEKKRNYLFNEFKDKTKSLKDITVWKTKLKNDFISNLNKIPENIKKDIIKRGDQQLTPDWGPLLAMDFLLYKKDGNRNIFQNKIMHRRNKLMRLVLAQLLTGTDKYINEIANGLWLILEESTWANPAHMSLQKAGVGLPDPNQNIIDLGVGETAAYVAWVKFLLGKLKNF